MIISGFATEPMLGPFDTACPDGTFRSGTFTVPAPTVLWVSASGLYLPKADAAAQAHRLYAEVTLTNTTGGNLAVTGLSSTAATGPGPLTVTGGLRNGGGTTFVLQPGTTYRLELALFARTNCVGGADLSSVRLDWLGFAAPA